MNSRWNLVQERLAAAAAILNDASPLEDTSIAHPLHVGVDLGTADVVVMVLDANGIPVAAFLEWAEVVRDGVVVDYVGAVDIVRKLVKKAEDRIGEPLTVASTSFPPGTDARLSTNILETAGLDLARIQDEPSCVASLLQLDKAAVVDIGGGSTGTAVVRKGEVVFSDDEPTGGKHLTLTIAGHYDISTEEAESRKRMAEEYNILSIALPNLERISDIVAAHISGHDVATIILSGGTCCLPGIAGVFEKELGLPAVLPCEPLLLTPLAIASLTLDPPAA